MNTTVTPTGTTTERTALVEAVEALKLQLRNLEEAMGGLAPDTFPHIAQTDCLEVGDWALELANGAATVQSAARTLQRSLDKQHQLALADEAAL